MLMKPIGSHLKTLSNSLLFDSTVQQSVLMSGFALPNVGFQVGSHWVSEGKMPSTQMVFFTRFPTSQTTFLVLECVQKYPTILFFWAWIMGDGIKYVFIFNPKP